MHAAHACTLARSLASWSRPQGGSHLLRATLWLTLCDRTRSSARDFVKSLLAACGRPLPVLPRRCEKPPGFLWASSARDFVKRAACGHPLPIILRRDMWASSARPLPCSAGVLLLARVLRAPCGRPPRSLWASSALLVGVLSAHDAATWGSTKKDRTALSRCTQSHNFGQQEEESKKKES
jgi:hypothetical protein